MTSMMQPSNNSVGMVAGGVVFHSSGGGFGGPQFPPLQVCTTVPDGVISMTFEGDRSVDCAAALVETAAMASTSAMFLIMVVPLRMRVPDAGAAGTDPAVSGRELPSPNRVRRRNFAPARAGRKTGILDWLSRETAHAAIR